MFIHVKGWAAVRGSGWLKDSGGGRGCNKRNGYSGPARMPSSAPLATSGATCSRSKGLLRIIVRTPTTPAPSQPRRPRPVPQVYFFRCPATALFSLCLLFYFDPTIRGEKAQAPDEYSARATDLSFHVALEKKNGGRCLSMARDEWRLRRVCSKCKGIAHGNGLRARGTVNW